MLVAAQAEVSAIYLQSPLVSDASALMVFGFGGICLVGLCGFGVLLSFGGLLGLGVFSASVAFSASVECSASVVFSASVFFLASVACRGGFHGLGLGLSGLGLAGLGLGAFVSVAY